MDGMTMYFGPKEENDSKNDPVKINSEKAITERCYHEAGHLVAYLYFKSMNLVCTVPTKICATETGEGNVAGFELDKEIEGNYNTNICSSSERFDAAILQSLSGYYTYKKIINDVPNWIGRPTGQVVVYDLFEDAIRSTIIKDFEQIRGMYEAKGLDFVMNETEKNRILEKLEELFRVNNFMDGIEYVADFLRKNINQSIEGEELEELIFNTQAILNS